MFTWIQPKYQRACQCIGMEQVFKAQSGMGENKLLWLHRLQLCSSVVVLQIKLEEEEIINEFNMRSAGVKKKHKQRLTLKMRNALYGTKVSQKWNCHEIRK